jgi:hypothetical protein
VDLSETDHHRRHLLTTGDQSRGDAGRGEEEVMMIASPDDVDSPPDECSDWWPAFPISDYLARRLEQQRHGQQWAVDLNPSQQQLKHLDVAARKPHPPVTEPSTTAPRAQSWNTNVTTFPGKSTRKPKTSQTRSFSCEEEGCSWTFKSKKDLRRHTTTVHQPLYQKCAGCKKLFKKRDDNLKRHQEVYCKGGK